MFIAKFLLFWWQSDIQDDHHRRISNFIFFIANINEVSDTRPLFYAVFYVCVCIVLHLDRGENEQLCNDDVSFY
jgi:hypothetical protein